MRSAVVPFDTSETLLVKPLSTKRYNQITKTKGDLEMNETNEGYERFDGCYGTVISRCLKGAYLELDNGEQAFAYKFANLFPGTKVLCTVLKRAAEGRRMLVSIDSVLRFVPVEV